MYTVLPPVFAGISPDESAEAQAFMTQVAFEAGDVVMLEGEDDRSAAFVLSGSLDISSNAVSLGHVGAREMIGEVELFVAMPRLSTVTATTACELLVLDEGGFQELLASGNRVAYAIERHTIRRLGDRIRQLNLQVADSTFGSERPAPTRTEKTLMDRLFSPFNRPPPPVVVDALACLRYSPVFNWAPDDAVRDMASLFESVSYEPGDPICRQGDASNHMFLIATGTVDVLLELSESRIERIATLSPGQAFGDSSIALGTPRAATCQARTKVTGLSMTRDRFLELYGLDAPIGSVFRQAIVQNLVTQLLASTDKLLAIATAHEMRSGARDDPGKQLWRD